MKGLFKSTVSKVIGVILLLGIILAAVFISNTVLDTIGFKTKRMDTIREYSVDYDKIPKLNKETAEKIKKVRIQKRNAFMILGVVVIVLLGFFVIFMQVRKGKNKE